MPILATATIPFRVNEDHSIDIIILNELTQRGCVNTEVIAHQLQKPFFEVRKAVAQLVGEEKIACDDQFVVCCADKSKLDELVQKMKLLRGE